MQIYFHLVWLEELITMKMPEILNIFNFRQRISCKWYTLGKMFFEKAAPVFQRNPNSQNMLYRAL